MEFNHYSVLLNETIKNLNIKPDGIYVDGTLGGGGHSYQICKRLENGHLYGIDQDEDALKAAGERLQEFGDKVTRIHDNFCNMKTALKNLSVEKVDGIVLDLGVSSYQFDTWERGFSYRFDGPLDMRMDQRQSLTAKEIVNTYSEKELFRIIRDYGEDTFAKNIAKHIVMAREKEEILTTTQLNEIIKNAIPAKMRKNRHPSKKTYQAIRMECNHELEVLKKALEELLDLLKPGGRLCIITFHSLEDRMVKAAFKEAENPCICPPEFPVCVCGRKPLGHNVTRKPILPGDKELEENNRSHSAKLRVFEKE